MQDWNTLPVDQTWFTVRNAIVCLIAHADCSYMLYSNPDELRMLAKLGDERASLLFTACYILNGVR